MIIFIGESSSFVAEEKGIIAARLTLLAAALRASGGRRACDAALQRAMAPRYALLYAHLAC